MKKAIIITIIISVVAGLSYWGYTSYTKSQSGSGESKPGEAKK